jgi:uncharacterized membrane protein YgaE (UPF0421/DUF939 family)
MTTALKVALGVILGVLGLALIGGVLEAGGGMLIIFVVVIVILAATPRARAWAEAHARKRQD